MLLLDIERSEYIKTYLPIIKNNNIEYLIQFLPECMIYLQDSKYVEYKNKKLKSDYLIDFIHSLVHKYYFKKINEYNLHSKFLKKKYGSNYALYKDYLLDKGLIILKRNYRVNKNAKIYKLEPDILKSDFSRHYNIDKFLIKKYKKRRTELELSDCECNNIDKLIKSKLINDLYKIDLHISDANDIISKVKDKDIYNKNKYSIECLEKNNIFYNFDIYGRFHTNFTTLKSEIRKNCLYFGNEKLVELDINNSQPLFFAKLLYETNTNLVDVFEFDNYKNLVTKGDFYQYLMDNSKTIIGKEIDRKTAKSYTYKVLFGRNYITSYADKLFQSLFPTIYIFIKDYKYREKDYRIISHELQKNESNLIFNKVVKNIFNEYPNIPIITIHDSIMFPESYYEKINEIFQLIINLEFIDI